LTSDRSFVVPADRSGERLDRYLADVLPSLSRSRVQALIRDGAVHLNGAGPRAAARLAAGDRVSVSLPPAEDDRPALVPAPEVSFDVLHADDAIVVVDKPAGLVVHPGAGHRGDTLVEGLLARFPELGERFEGPRPGIVHRLDRDTSGVMVVARTVAAAKRLRAQFKRQTVEKVYLALAKGAVRPAAGIIDAPIGRDPARRKRMAALPAGRPSRTRYRVLGEAEGYSWLEVRPRTGRTHQIRVHLAAIGHPVAGDPVYGRRDKRVGRLALHAWQLSFDHPRDGERVRFRAPLPDDLVAAVEGLGLRLEPEERARG
jgi:23S rRNA pseudouridine1911/1915/1917 synthase